MKCIQQDCKVNAAYRYTWPGRVEAGACVEHARWITTIAESIEVHLQLIEVEPDSDSLVVNELRVEADRLPPVHYLVLLLRKAADEILLWRGRYMALELECSCGAAVEVEIVEDDGTVHFDTPEGEQG